MNNIILQKLIGLIYPNYSINNEVISNQDSLCQQCFLQKKRSLEINNNYFQNKNNNDQIKFYRENHLFAPKLVNPPYSNLYQFKLDDSSNYGNFIVNNNIIKQNFNINNIGNLNYNLNGEYFKNYRDRKYSFENLNQDINKINIKGSLNEKSHTKYSFEFNKYKNAFSNKRDIFEITKVKEKRHIKKLSNKKIIQIENSNKIKVIKNKKVVYDNSSLLIAYPKYKNIKSLKKVFFVGINRRGSKYRGVSKNGNQYQVLIMINKKKMYIGSYPVEEDAARIYDILTLKFRGIKAKTNYYYSYEQIKKILELDSNIKNIYQLISKINK